MATTHTLKAETRTCVGTGKLNQLRRDGWTPGVVYGSGIETFNVQLNARELGHLLAHTSSSILVELSVEGKTHTALLKDVQRDALTGEYLHIDFLYVSADTVVYSSVPVELVGEPAGAKMGGVLDQAIHEIHISCKVKDMPESIKVDVVHLGLGAAIRVGEVQFPEGVTTSLNPGVVVAIVLESAAAQSESKS